MGESRNSLENSSKPILNFASPETMLRERLPSSRAFSSSAMNLRSFFQSLSTSGFLPALMIASWSESPCLAKSITFAFASFKAITLWCSPPALNPIYDPLLKTPLRSAPSGASLPLEEGIKPSEKTRY